MSGGSWERTATFNSVDSKGYFLTYGWTTATGLTVDSSSTKYATKYINTSGLPGGNAVVYTYGKVGDATKEVNTGGAYYGISTTYHSNWFSEFFNFAYVGTPFIMRGGSPVSDYGSGIFVVYLTPGNSAVSTTFRTVLCPDSD
jgi:hypothetical protein